MKNMKKEMNKMEMDMNDLVNASGGAISQAEEGEMKKSLRKAKAEDKTYEEWLETSIYHDFMKGCSGIRAIQKYIYDTL